MINLTPELWKKIQAINTYVNGSVRYVSDKTQYGKSDHWALPHKGTGDCEDYSLQKQFDLTQEGLESYIATAWCFPDHKGYHAVCIVPTDYGDYVLDNRYPDVYHWEDSNYKWHMRETEDLKWVKINV